MIIKGEKFFHRAFRPCFIYNNSCKSACQEQADFPHVLTVSELLFTPFSVTRFAMHRIYANRINSRPRRGLTCFS